MICPAPNRWFRSRCRRTIVDSSFCAGTVPSHVSTGFRQVSQLPQSCVARLAEVGEQLAPPAADRLAERQHRVEVRGLLPLVRGVADALLDEAPLLHDVLQPVGEPRGRGQAVAARAPGLLVVPLHRLRHVDVRDEPHVRLVDAHAERDRRDHHDAVVAEEPRLVRRADPGVEARVVRHGVDPVLGEPGRGLLDAVPRQRVDDARVAAVLVADQLQQLLLRVVLRHDPVLDVRPVEARDDVGGALEVQARGELAVRRLRRGRGERHRRDARPAADEVGERRGSRGGSRAPTARRSGPRRSRRPRGRARRRRGRACCAPTRRRAAPARCRSGRRRRRAAPARPPRRSAGCSASSSGTRRARRPRAARRPGRASAR